MAYPVHKVFVRNAPIFLLMLLPLLLPGCVDESPIKIGFLGGITGRVSDLGVAGRDAVLFAVEEKNRAGGINGRRVELIVKDDQQDNVIVLQALHELIDEKVTAIVGPMTSSMAVKVQPLVNEHKVVMVSPTAKTDQLSGLDDYFLRVTIQLSDNAKKMAHHVVYERGLKRFGVVYDLTNKAFTETWLDYFQQAMAREGGEVVYSEGFNLQEDTRFLPMAERVLGADVEGVLLLSNAIDTALMAQQIRKLGSQVEMYSSEWAFTVDLLSFGGRAVEGMTSFHTFNVNSEEPRYVKFRDAFTKRFGYPPSFATALAYDATTFLLAGLEKQPPPGQLKKTLLEMGTFPGLQSEIRINEFGDVERKLFLTVVRDGQFQVVDSL